MNRLNRRWNLGGHFVHAALVDVDALRGRAPSAVHVRPQWLHPAEWEEAEAVTDRWRRWQWLAGRLAARQVLALAGGPSGREVRVLSRAPSGCPMSPQVFVGGSARADWLSIAHDGALAVAVIASRPVGVDIVAPGRLCGDAARRWALHEARFKLQAAVEASGRRSGTLPPTAAGRVAPSGPAAELVTAVQDHVVAVCTLWEAA